MNKCLKALLFSALALMLSAFCGCGRSAFRAEEYVLTEPVIVSDPDKAGKKSIAIGGSVYTCTYDSSCTSGDPAMTVDFYNTSEGGRIEIDPETDEVYSFADITPFESIGSVSELTDEELIRALEERVAPIADPERYNDHKIQRQAGNGPENPDAVVEFHRSFYGVDSYDQMIVRLNASGDIIRFSRMEGFPKDFDAPDISDAERDELILGVVKEKLGIEPGEIRIISSYMTVYKGRPALICYPMVFDKDGNAVQATISVVIYRG